MNNSEQFKKFLDDNHLTYEALPEKKYQGQTLSEYIVFQKLDNGQIVGLNVKLGEHFMITTLLHYIKANDSANKNKVYALINEINGQYSYIKFILDSSSQIQIVIGFPVFGSLGDEHFGYVIEALMDAANSEYEKLSLFLS